jgi:hypothetical protein
MSKNKTQHNESKKINAITCAAASGKSVLNFTKFMFSFGKKAKILRIVKSKKISRFKSYRRKEKHWTELYKIR